MKNKSKTWIIVLVIVLIVMLPIMIDYFGSVKIEKITFQSSSAPRLGIDWLTSIDDPNMNTIIEIPYNEDPNYGVASYFDGNVSVFLENLKYFDLLTVLRNS